MANLASLEDVEAVLIREVTEAAEIASVEFALAVVSQAIRTYTNQYLERVTDETIRLSVLEGPLIFLPQLPVMSVATVRENGVLLSSATDYQLAAHGVLTRRHRRTWYPGVETVEVKYTHGFSPIPDDIRGVAARAASRLFQAGLRAADTAGVLGIASKSLGDFSVSYAGEASAAEGQMGASGARVLSLSDKDMLAKYIVK